MFIEAPRVAQTDIHFPLAVVCKGCPPVKNATHKVRIKDEIMTHYGGRKKDKYEILYSEFNTSNGREVLYFRDLQLCVPHKWGPTLFVSTLNSQDRKLFL